MFFIIMKKAARVGKEYKKPLTNLGGRVLSPVWILPLLSWMVNQMKINYVSKYLFFVWFHFLSSFKYKNLKYYKISNLSLPVWESININPIMSLVKWNLTKLDICQHCLFWFDLPLRKEEGKFIQGTKNVHQSLSKVFVQGVLHWNVRF